MPKSKFLLLTAYFLLLVSCPSIAKDYDGIWFLGFNVNKPPFNDQGVRQAVGAVIDKTAISRLVSAEVTPHGFVPPAMLGFDPDLKFRKLELKEARQLMKEAGYSLNDKRLKNISLLHTDGLVTIAIARQIRDDLSELGINVRLKQVPFADETSWVDQLESGGHQLFLMGYKAYTEQLFTEEAGAGLDSASLLEPLFKTGGGANFTGYSSAKVDQLFGQLESLAPALRNERHKVLKQINQQLAVDKPAVVLFYIEKL